MQPMTFRLAREEELKQIYALYRSLVGTPFCVWNDAYPGMEEVLADFRTGNLYVLTCAGQLLGALSAVPENELDGCPGWSSGERVRELARVAVARDARGQGLAGQMVRSILPILKAQGCRWVHLSVAKDHLPAQKTYQKAGFHRAGTAKLFGGDYVLMEKAL